MTISIVLTMSGVAGVITLSSSGLRASSFHSTIVSERRGSAFSKDGHNAIGINNVPKSNGVSLLVDDGMVCRVAIERQNGGE